MRGTTNTERADGPLLDATTALGYRKAMGVGFKLTRDGAGHWDGQRFVSDTEIEWDDLPTGRGQR